MLTAWTRGVETAEITSPVQQRIGIRAFGWSKATNGEVTGNVVLVNIQNPSDFDQYKGKLKGDIVLLRKPVDMAKREANPENAYDAVIPQPRGVPQPNGGYRGRMQLIKQTAAEQPALMLMDSGKIDSLYNMTGGFRKYSASDVPMAFLTHEDYDLLYRLLQAGPVTMKANLPETFSDKPVPASITVAEIKGSEHPDERVIVGGHLDSWDLGQGALDNGTGAMATLEAARALKALGWKPKRTITFISVHRRRAGRHRRRHLSQEPRRRNPQDGRHPDPRHRHRQGIQHLARQLVGNCAADAARSISRYRKSSIFSRSAPAISAHRTTCRFLNKGVPAYFCIQLPARYGEAHHSQTDTFDKVIPDQINEGAAFLAAWAWNVSEMPEPLPHHARASNADGVRKQLAASNSETVGANCTTRHAEYRCLSRYLLASVMNTRFPLPALDAAECGVQNQLIPQSLFAGNLEVAALLDGSGKRVHLRAIRVSVRHFPALHHLNPAPQLDNYWTFYREHVQCRQNSVFTRHFQKCLVRLRPETETVASIPLSNSSTDAAEASRSRVRVVMRPRRNSAHFAASTKRSISIQCTPISASGLPAASLGSFTQVRALVSIGAKKSQRAICGCPMAPCR